MPSLRAALISLSLALVAAAPAHAANGEATRLNLQEEAPRAVAAQAGSSGSPLVRTIVGLAVVIGVIYGLTWVLRQVKQSKEATASGAGLATLATLPLGPNRSLHLVQAGEEVVLLGAGEGGVTTIRTYRSAEARELGLLDEDAAPAAPAERAGSLVEALRRKTVIK